MDKNKNKAEKAEKNSQTKDNAPEIVDDLEEVVDSPDAEPDEAETLTMQLEATREREKRISLPYGRIWQLP